MHEEKQKLLFSKYDIVKIRVYVNDSHYYVLSRFLISRILTSAQVHPSHAARISLDLKKHLVDTNKLEISQSHLEAELFSYLRIYGYEIGGVGFILNFHHKRIPLLVFLAGARGSGKSTLASLLSERLNLPSVLSTDIVYQVIRNLGHQGNTYEQECDLVETGIMGDMKRLVADGKSIVIEGYHVSGDIVTKVRALSDTAVIASFLISPEEATDASKTFQPICYDKINPSHALDAMQKSILDKIKQVNQ